MRSRTPSRALVQEKKRREGEANLLQKGRRRDGPMIWFSSLTARAVEPEEALRMLGGAAKGIKEECARPGEASVSIGGICANRPQRAFAPAVVFSSKEARMGASPSTQSTKAPVADRVDKIGKRPRHAGTTRMGGRRCGKGISYPQGKGLNRGGKGPL